MKRCFCLVAFVVALVAAGSVVQANHICPELRGDANLSGSINLTDVVFLNNFLFQGGPAPLCMDAADADANGTVNITDTIFLLNFLFQGGPAPQPFLVNCPFTCGVPD